jgi:hypothetical protein
MAAAANLAGVRAELDSLRARLDTMVAMSGGTRVVVPVPRVPASSDGGRWKTSGRHASGVRPTAVPATARAIAWALELPVQARRRFRADSESVLAHADKKVPIAEGLAAWHPAAKVSALWRADLADDLAWRYEYESRAWGYAALRWLLVDAGGGSGWSPASEDDAELADAARLRAITGEAADVAEAASRSRIRQARQALVDRLSTDVDRLLRGPCEGQCEGQVDRDLLAATAEATLLAGSLTYACWPRAALAQAYFIQALALAQACGDRQQGVAILCAMSKQAAFCGQLEEERNLLKTALKGCPG